MAFDCALIVLHGRFVVVIGILIEEGKKKNWQKLERPVDTTPSLVAFFFVI